jgi:hypothetical protein
MLDGKSLLRQSAETCKGVAMHKLRTLHADPKQKTGNIANNAIGQLTGAEQEAD